MPVGTNTGRDSHGGEAINVLGGVVVAIIGGVLGVAGFYFYQSASQVISRDERLWGLGWLVQNVSQEEANLYQIGGIAGMVVGGIIVLGGLILMMRRRG